VLRAIYKISNNSDKKIFFVIVIFFFLIHKKIKITMSDTQLFLTLVGFILTMITSIVLWSYVSTHYINPDVETSATDEEKRAGWDKEPESILGFIMFGVGVLGGMYCVKVFMDGKPSGTTQRFISSNMPTGWYQPSSSSSTATAPVTTTTN
jgi:hypothetical protein